SKEEVVGTYKLINHGREISADIHYSTLVVLQEDGRVEGDSTGTWELLGENQIEIVLDEIVYQGVFLKQYDENNKIEVMTFTAGSAEGITIWGSMLYLKS
ncbi:MAG: endo-alpha-(1-_5)-L-arabinanase, partial [Vallitaleaceae bacterium]|nr:endo-alpha-(1->5)-L-arabinanase [Vallitaleaceae bacterium]